MAAMKPPTRRQSLIEAGLIDPVVRHTSGAGSAPMSRRRVMAAMAAAGAGWLSAAPTRAEGSRALLRRWPAEKPTPSLVLPGQGGTAWNLAALKGQVVVLNFWASWCEPCRSEMPSLELLAQRHEADGVSVIAVNVRETDAALARFLERTPMTLPIVRDGDGLAMRAWGVRVLPTTILVGRDGRARFSIIGEADWTGSLARQWIEPLL
jgi:thiol-disulfide isomerase/thioredoxin